MTFYEDLTSYTEGGATELDALQQANVPDYGIIDVLGPHENQSRQESRSIWLRTHRRKDSFHDRLASSKGAKNTPIKVIGPPRDDRSTRRATVVSHVVFVGW